MSTTILLLLRKKRSLLDKEGLEVPDRELLDRSNSNNSSNNNFNEALHHNLKTSCRCRIGNNLQRGEEEIHWIIKEGQWRVIFVIVLITFTMPVQTGKVECRTVRSRWSNVNMKTRWIACLWKLNRASFSFSETMTTRTNLVVYCLSRGTVQFLIVELREPALGIYGSSPTSLLCQSQRSPR